MIHWDFFKKRKKKEKKIDLEREPEVLSVLWPVTFNLGQGSVQITVVPNLKVKTNNIRFLSTW